MVPSSVTSEIQYTEWTMQLQPKEKEEKNKKNNTQRNAVIRLQYLVTEVLTRFLGCDIDYVALWAHSSAVVSPQTHVIGAAAFQIPDEY